MSGRDSSARPVINGEEGRERWSEGWREGRREGGREEGMDGWREGGRERGREGAAGARDVMETGASSELPERTENLTCQTASLHSYLHTHLRAYVPTFIPTYLPTRTWRASSGGRPSKPGGRAFSHGRGTPVTSDLETWAPLNQRQTAVERTRHSQDSQGHILSVAFR